jgi:hypothetical protein
MNTSDTINMLLNLAAKHLGIRFANQLFCVLLLLFSIEKKVIIKKLGVSRLSLKNMTNYCSMVLSTSSLLIMATDVPAKRKTIELKAE